MAGSRSAGEDDAIIVIGLTIITLVLVFFGAMMG